MQGIRLLKNLTVPLFQKNIKTYTIRFLDDAGATKINSQFFNNRLISSFALLLIAIIFASILGSGVYGYGND